VDKDIVHESSRRSQKGIVEIWPLVEPDKEEKPDPWMAPVDMAPANAPHRKLARKIADAVKSWIGRRRIGGSGRDVTAGDILILVRRRSALFDAIISELRRNAIPVAGADRLILRENIAVLDTVALANFVLLPEDDYSLACLLKSPLVNAPLGEEELFDLCHRRGNASLWQRLQCDQSEQCRVLSAQLSGWIARAALVPPYEFLAGAVQPRLLAIAARLGSEAKDALDAFLQSALDHGRNRAPSLSSFISWFQQSEIEIKRDMEHGRGEVRVMTVHGAKGLEAPIVFLPDTAGIPQRTNARDQVLEVPIGNGGRKIPVWAVPKLRNSQKMDALRQLAEEAGIEEFHRLLYVAMTRARDELYVCGYRNSRKPASGNWFERVKDELLKLEDMRELPDGQGWRMGADPVPGDGPAKERRWPVKRPQWIGAPVRQEPTEAWASVTRLAAGDQDRVPASQEVRDRGSLIHRLLQVLPDVPENDRPALAQMIVARAKQPSAIANEALALLAHPLLAPLLRGEALAEVSLSAPLPDLGVTVSGRIDRLIVGPNEVTIVDYKSDHQWPLGPEQVPVRYARQMALYRAVMENAYPGRGIHCVLVWTAAPQVMELPSSFLDRTLTKLKSART
jgi:ATP-dependent helicase/nuclease subunit A